MATVGEVREALFPAVAPIPPADPGRLEATVGWVRVLRPRVPAFDTLEPGDLVIVPAGALAVVAPTHDDRTGLVAAFARAGIAGLIIAGGDGPGPPAEGGDADPAHDLAAIAGGVGLPAFRLPGADPGALERSSIGLLVNRRAELEHQASLLEQRLERLALGEADLPGMVAEIGTFLGRAVALEGRRGDALAVHAPVGDTAAAGAVGRYLAGTRTAALRVRLPERAASAPAGPGGTPARAGGSLVLLGERPPTELDRVAADRIAGLLALELARDEAVRQAQEAVRRGEALPADGPPWAVLVARQLEPGARTSLEQREAVRRDLRLLAPARRLSFRGSGESLELRVVLAADAADPGGLELAGRIAASLERPVAVSRPFGLPTERPVAEADARATLEAAETVAALDPTASRRRVARADRLAADRLVAALYSAPDGRRLADALLAPLLDGRRAVVRERLATLRAILDGPGPAEAATRLGIHRNTLAYRLRRIEALTGWRLNDPELRLPLAVAVRIVQSAQDRDTER